MTSTIKILKILVAIGFLVVAYLFFTEQTLFGLRPVVPLLIVSVIGAIVLYTDYRSKNLSKKDRK